MRKVVMVALVGLAVGACAPEETGIDVVVDGADYQATWACEPGEYDVDVTEGLSYQADDGTSRETTLRLVTCANPAQPALESATLYLYEADDKPDTAGVDIPWQSEVEANRFVDVNEWGGGSNGYFEFETPDMLITVDWSIRF